MAHGSWLMAHGLMGVRLMADGSSALPEPCHLARYSSSADRLMRHDVPIFLPASSPDSRIDSTSASGTPSAFATSAGARSSGSAVAIDGAPAGRVAAVAA